MTKPKRYFIDRDENGHWYVIDASRRSAWEKWQENYERGDVPKGADEIGGGPQLIEFSDPKHKYG